MKHLKKQNETGGQFEWSFSKKGLPIHKKV